MSRGRTEGGSGGFQQRAEASGAGAGEAEGVGRAASGLEAVVGYLYLSGQEERLLQVLARALELEQVRDIVRPKPFKG